MNIKEIEQCDDVQKLIIHGRGQRDREIAMKFAWNVKRLGFRVFLSESREYGFITDDSESRVLSFGTSYRMINLSGNYQPSTSHGSGWSIAKDLDVFQNREFIQKCLYMESPFKNTVLSTVKDYMGRYNSSSKFTEI